MDLAQRSYSGHSFRPRPVIEELRAQQTLIVATSWGEPEHARQVVEIIKEQVNAASNPEATRIGQFIPELTESGNNLRTAALLANEQLYLRENSKEYSAAVEVALITVQKQVLSWVQIGTPHLILKNESGMQPLVTQPDWAWQLQQDTPLVCKALGLERHCYPHCGSFRLRGREKLVLLSRSAVPSKMYLLPDADLQTCSTVLVEDHEKVPFWLGVLSL